jgi:hypothetical protein
MTLTSHTESRPSDIVGKGHGDAHLWRYDGSNNGGNSFYICERCRAGFCHSYRRIANIFEAMKIADVPLECKALSDDSRSVEP